MSGDMKIYRRFTEDLQARHVKYVLNQKKKKKKKLNQKEGTY